MIVNIEKTKRKRKKKQKQKAQRWIMEKPCLLGKSFQVHVTRFIYNFCLYVPHGKCSVLRLMPRGYM